MIYLPTSSLQSHVHECLLLFFPCLSLIVLELAGLLPSEELEKGMTFEVGTLGYLPNPLPLSLAHDLGLLMAYRKSTIRN